MLEFQDSYGQILVLSWHVLAKKISWEKQHFFLKMTCPHAGHDLVSIGTVVHPDLLKYALGVNKYPPKRRDTELELFLKKKKKNREKHLGRGTTYHDL